MNYNEEIEKLSNLDPLKEAEKLTGLSYKEDDSTSSFGFFLQMEKSKRMQLLMDQTDDTKFSEITSDYIKKLVTHGFIKVLELPFTNSYGIIEKFYIFFDYDRCILLTFDTHTWGDDGSWAKSGKTVPPPSVNGGHFYYNWSPLKNHPKRGTSSGGFAFKKESKNRELILLNDDLEIVDAIIPERLEYRCSMSDEYRKVYDARNKEIDDELSKYRFVWIGNHDCREAVFFNINNLEKNGDFLKVWLEKSWDNIYPFHYMDWKQPNFDCDTVRIERLKLLPKEVREKINFTL